jgi:hypothetical protein
MDMRPRPSRPNRIENPRLLAASKDPRIAAIEEAVRHCNPSGVRRENWMYGRTVLPKVYVALLEELSFGAATPEQIMALGDAMRDAAYSTARDERAPDSVADCLALEAVIEGEANRDVMKLLDNPKCPNRLRLAAAALRREAAASYLSSDRVMIEAHRLEAAQRAAR